MNPFSKDLTNTYRFNWHNLTQVHAELDSNGLTACQQEELMRQIFYPKSGYELQVSIFHRIRVVSVLFVERFPCSNTICRNLDL